MRRRFFFLSSDSDIVHLLTYTNNVMKIGAFNNFVLSASKVRLFRSAVFIIVVSVSLLVINEYFLRIKFNVWPAVPYIFYWLIIAIAFFYLLLIPWQRYNENNERLMVEAFMTGIILGLAIAVYKTFAYRELWTIFNLLAEPIRIALFGLLVIWVLNERGRALTINQTTQ